MDEQWPKPFRSPDKEQGSGAEQKPKINLNNRYADPILREYEEKISGLLPAKEILQKVVAAEIKTNYKTGQRILEIGAGQGDSAKPVLESSDVSLDLLDVSPEMIEKAKMKLEGFGKRANFICEDGLLYLTRCDPYDTIFSELTVHNFDREQKRHLLSAIHDKLKSDGTFILMDKIYPDKGAQELHDRQMKRYQDNLPPNVAKAIIAHEDEDFYSDDYRAQETDFLAVMRGVGFNSIRIIERIERDVVILASK